MKVEDKAKHLETVAEIKQRALIRTSYSDGSFKREIIGRDKLNFHHLVQIDQFMRKVLRYIVLFKKKDQKLIDPLVYLPLPLKKKSDDVWYEYERDQKNFLELISVNEFSFEFNGFECSPLVQLFEKTKSAASFLKISKLCVKPQRQFAGKKSSNLLHSPEDKIKPLIAEYIKRVQGEFDMYSDEIKKWDSSANSNFRSLHSSIHSLVRTQGNLHITQMKLLYNRDWFSVHRKNMTCFKEVKKNIACLLRSKKNKDLNQKITGYLWKIEFADEGVQVHLVLFLSLDIKPKSFLIQLGERWVSEVVADSAGGYATPWLGGENTNDFLIFLADSKLSDWRVKVDGIIHYVVLQDLLLRYRGDEKEVQTDGEWVAESTERKSRPRSFAFGFGEQERTRLAVAKQARPTRKKSNSK